MTRGALFTGLGALILGVCPPLVVSEAATDRQTRTFAADRSRPVHVRITVGSLKVTAWDRKEIAVEVTREGGDDRTLPIVLEESDESIGITAVQPSDERDPARRVEVVVRVPANADLRAVEIFEGSLSAAGLRGGTLQAKVERGPIALEDVTGILRLETTSGDITVDRATLITQGLIRCRTFNGNIRVVLTVAPTDARILALTLNGTITSNLPLAERSGFGPRFREGIFGAGHPLISVDAVRGNVTVSVAGQ